MAPTSSEHPSSIRRRISRRGSGGSIGGEKLYQVEMPSFGANAERGENVISDQDAEDLIAYLTTAAR